MDTALTAVRQASDWIEGYVLAVCTDPEERTRGPGKNQRQYLCPGEA